MVSKVTALLLLLTIVSIEAAIYKQPTKNERLFQQQSAVKGASVPIHEVQQHLERLRRAAAGNGHEPIFQKSLLNDTGNVGLVQYAGNDSKVIYVLTHSIIGNTIISSNVYRSSDYGYSFTNISSKVGNGALLGRNIFTSPVDNQRVYFTDNTESAIYISTDEGVTFTKRSFSPNNILTSSLKVHPTIEDWVLAVDNDNNLFVSQIFGRKPFKKIAEDVVFYQWGEYPFDQDHSTVYYGVFTDTEDQYELYTQHVPYDDSSMSLFDSTLGFVNGFLMVDRYVFAQKTDSNGVVSLWVSADRKPFKKAKIPSNEGHENYLVDSIKSIQAMVIVQHSSGVFNLYMSEENGELYYLALDDISVLVGGGFIAIDLEAIESMNYTTYIANQFIRYTDVGDDDPSIRTLISFDVGANWELLTPPTSSDDECIQPLCSLHLHMSTSEYWRTGVYSQESAPGIIIAHGATGDVLTDDNTNLFISRDGGSTWSKTIDGTWGVSVLDLGGLIVAARDYHAGANKSRILKYSCNEGMTWSDLTFTNNNLYVYAVISEPGETTTVVSLYGVEEDVNSWAVVTIDFKNIFPKECGPEDYYPWTPFDDNTDTGCLLGASVSVERHLPSVCCRNGQDYNRETSYRICECSEEDFECDYGYKHADGYSGACIRDTEVTLDTPCSSDKDLTYTQSQGYHKIGGDVCSGGDESVYTAVQMPCCYTSSGSSSSTTTSVVLGVFVILALVIIGVFAVVMTVCIIKYFRSRAGHGQSAGYRVAPTYEPSSPPDTPTTVGVQNINYEDKDDDDAALLTP